ncbi:MAG: PAS domain S-box protein [Anaerolineales bacterium]
MKKASSQIKPQEKELPFQGIFEAAYDGLIISDVETGIVVEANSAACRMHGQLREGFVGQKLSTFVHPEDRDQFGQHLYSLQMDGDRDLHTRQECGDGQTFSAEWRASMFNYQGRLCFLSIVRDVSERVNAEQSLHQLEQIYTHEQATLLEISHTLASTLEFHPGQILDRLREMVEYDQGGLFVLEGSDLVDLALRGTAHQGTSGAPQADARATEITPEMLGGHQPVRISDLRNEDKPNELMRKILGNVSPGLFEKMHSLLWVPLVVKGTSIGGFALAHAKENFFTAHHADLALSVANQAAITMTNAQLVGKAQAVAVVEERQRMARNLHDAVNQSLFSAGLIAEVLPRLWERDQEEARHSLEDLRRLTRGAMAEMRALLAELRPSTLTDADLGELLEQLAEAFRGRTNVPAQVTVQGTGVLPAEVQVAVYRVCQEALNNIAKHAEASKVEIGLELEDANCVLSIRDDGHGFEPEQTSSGHYGLSMMRERASAVGAILSITSQPGHGAELTIRWAIPPRGAA